MPDLILLDEAHEDAAEVCAWARKHGITVWGLTASPFKKQLGASFTDMVCPVTTNELIREGSLVPIRPYIAREEDLIDTEGVSFNSETGLYVASELDGRVKKVVGGMVEHYEQRALQFFNNPVEQCMVFAHDIKSAEGIAEEFRVNGHSAVHVASSLPQETNAGRIADFRRGDIQVLVNVAILTRGFDHPGLRMCLDAFPLRGSKQWWIQKLGRLMRPYPNKPFGVWLDHAFNVPQFAEFTQEFFASGPPGLEDLAARLKEDEPVDMRKGAGSWVCRDTVSLGEECGTFNPTGTSHCETCLSVRPDLRCPKCGFEHHDPWTDCNACGSVRDHLGKPAGPGTETVEVTAVFEEGLQLGDGSMLEPEAFPALFEGDKERLYSELLRYCIDHPSKRGTPAMNVAAGKFKSIMGHWPAKKRGVEPAEACSPLVEGEVKRQQLLWKQAAHQANPPVGQNQCPRCGSWKQPKLSLIHI